MRKSVAVLALLLAVCHFAAATINVQVLFGQNYTCNVTAHFNHEDNVIIRLTPSFANSSNDTNHTNGTNQSSTNLYETGFIYSNDSNHSNHSNTTNSSLPTLQLLNLAGYYPVTNATSLLTEVNSTNGTNTTNTRTYQFKYWDARFNNKACLLHFNQTLICRFRLYSPVTFEETDLYISMQSPNTTYCGIRIVGSDYNNVTRDRSIIDTREVARTQYVSAGIQVAILGYDISSPVRYFVSNASDFNSSWMMSNLKPVFLGFQCYYENSNSTNGTNSTSGTNSTNSTNVTSFNLHSTWTGDDIFFDQTVFDLSRTGLPLSEDSSYWCNVSVVATERSNNHSLIAINVKNLLYFEGSSNHSNHTNTTNHTITVDRSVIFRTKGQYHRYNLKAEFNKSQGEDIFITLSDYSSSNFSNSSNGSNCSSPSLSLANFADNFPVRNESSILSVYDQTNSSITYRFRYWQVLYARDSPCALAYNATTCRFLLSVPRLRQNTELFISISEAFSNYTDLNIVGAGFNNETSNRYSIDTLENQVTESLQNSITYTVSDVLNQSSEVKYIDLGASDSFSYEIAASVIKPRFIGFKCFDNQTNFTVVSPWKGCGGIYSQTPVDISAYGLPTNKSYWCETALFFTENSNQHSLLTFRVKNEFFFNESNYHPNHTNGSNSSNSSWGFGYEQLYNQSQGTANQSNSSSIYSSLYNFGIFRFGNRFNLTNFMNFTNSTNSTNSTNFINFINFINSTNFTNFTNETGHFGYAGSSFIKNKLRNLQGVNMD